MPFKIISTALLIIIASALLINLAFKVRTGTTSDLSGKSQVASKGCCGSSGGGCASGRQNQAKGE